MLASFRIATSTTSVEDGTQLGDSDAVPTPYDNFAEDPSKPSRYVNIGASDYMYVGRHVWEGKGVYIYDTSSTRVKHAFHNEGIDCEITVTNDYPLKSRTASATATVLGDSLDSYTNIIAILSYSVNAVVGRYNELVIVTDDDEIINVIELWGLHLSLDRRSIIGIVGFTEPKLLDIKTRKGINYKVTVKPTHLERVI